MSEAKIEYLQTDLRQVVLPEQGTGHLLNCTFATQPCGCKIIGNGTIPHPLEIEWCPKHAAAPDLLAACEAMLAAMDGSNYGYRDEMRRRNDARKAARTAIAKAKPEPGHK